jgi:hypothetical protein
VLKTCCIIGTWVQDHLLRETWPSPLGMSSGVEDRVFYNFPVPPHLAVRPAPRRSDRQPLVQPPTPSSRVSRGCPYIYVPTPKAIHHLIFDNTSFSNMNKMEFLEVLRKYVKNQVLKNMFLQNLQRSQRKIR